MAELLATVVFSLMRANVRVVDSFRTNESTMRNWTPNRSNKIPSRKYWFRYIDMDQASFGANGSAARRFASNGLGRLPIARDGPMLRPCAVFHEAPVVTECRVMRSRSVLGTVPIEGNGTTYPKTGLRPIHQHDRGTIAAMRLQVNLSDRSG